MELISRDMVVDTVPRGVFTQVITQTILQKELGLTSRPMARNCLASPVSTLE